MTHFEQIQSQYQQRREQFLQWKQAHHQFALRLLTAIQDMLQCPPDSLEPAPTQEAVQSCLTFDEEGLWHFPVCLIVQDAESQAMERLQIPLSFIQRKPDFELFLGEPAAGTRYWIDPSGEELDRFLKQLLYWLEQQYREPFDWSGQIQHFRRFDQPHSERVLQPVFYFAFEDLPRLDTRQMQTVLHSLKNETIVLALKNCSDGVKTHFLSSMSKNAARMLQEDLEVMGPVKLSDVEAAQQTILQTIAKMEEEGKIVIPQSQGSP
ncbi:FliG C-terminal domain-containing protein [Deltaproteobacteria bacterium TL4]